MIPIACPLLGVEEEAAVQRVLASGQLAQGRQVEAFEQHFAEFCHVREAVAVSSGTAALYLALLAHDIGPGDEVITSAFSFSATANAIVWTGARPVFVDIEPDYYTLDPDCVAAALTPRTKALLPVHLYGHPASMARLVQLVSQHHLAIIEDACQAHAAHIHGQPVGSFGSGCFSFYVTKNMTTGEGGMVTTNDPTIARRVRLLRSHGQRTHHQQTMVLGQNLRLTEMQAALGIAQLARLSYFTEQRIANAAYLTTRLQGFVQTPLVRPGYQHVYHQYTIRIPSQRDEWLPRLRQSGVDAAIHYDHPIYDQPFYRQHPHLYRVSSEGLPETERAAREVLSLPVHPALTADDLGTIAREVTELCR